MLDFLFGRARQETGPETLPGVGPQGRNRKRDRVEREVFMIAPRFTNSGGVNFDKQNGDWLMIPSYPLPDRWQQRWCKLLIVFPLGYPVTPPIGFYLNKQFVLKGGNRDDHLTGQAYYGAADLRKSGWYWYCVQIGHGAWQPQADHTRPDNLWTFLNMVRESLTNDI